MVDNSFITTLLELKQLGDQTQSDNTTPEHVPSTISQHQLENSDENVQETGQGHVYAELNHNNLNSRQRNVTSSTAIRTPPPCARPSLSRLE